MTHGYEAFGLSIRSNRELAGLPARDVARVDLDVEFEEGPPPPVDHDVGETTSTTGWGEVRACKDGGRLVLAASHGGAKTWSMRVGGDGRSIAVRWRGSVALADIATLVETMGLSTALALRGVPVLHGCAVAVGDGAFVVLGAGGAGKSTVAAAAVAAGYPLLTDDIAVLDGEAADVRVHSGGSRLRMNEDTARAMGWDPAGLAPVFQEPGLPVKFSTPLSTGDGTLCDSARSLGAIFLLGERRAAPVAIDRLDPSAAIATILRNTFGDRAVDARVRSRLLPFWTRLAGEVPVHAVAPAEGFGAVASLVEVLAATTSARP